MKRMEVGWRKGSRRIMEVQKECENKWNMVERLKSLFT